MKKVNKLANEIREVIDSGKYLQETLLKLILNKCDKHAPIEKPFPKMMASNHSHEKGVIVWFYSRTKGVVVELGDCEYYHIGKYLNSISAEYFDDCEIQVKP